MDVFQDHWIKEDVSEAKLGEKYHTSTLMHIVRECLIPIINHCAIYQRGLVLAYG